MSVCQFASLRQCQRIPLLWLNVGLIGFAVAWFVIRQPED